MRSKLARIIGVAALLCLSLTLCAGGASAADTKVLRLQCVYPETSHGGENLKALAEKVAKYTNGQVTIKIFWPNQLVKLQEAYTALSKGMIDMLYAGSIYYTGIVPAAKSEFLPMTWKNPDEAFDLYYNHGFLDLLRKANAQKGVWYLCPTFLASMGLMTNFEVTGLESFKGRKIRAVSMDALVMREVGAAPVAMAPTETYAAIKRGTIDGTVYPYYSLDTYKFSEVVTCATMPGLHSPVPVNIFMNLKVWQSFSPEIQKAFERAGKETCQVTAKLSEKWDNDALVFAKSHKVKVFELNAADQKKLMEISQAEWKKAAAQTPELKEAVDLILKYIKSKEGK